MGMQACSDESVEIIVNYKAIIQTNANWNLTIGGSLSSEYTSLFFDTVFWRNS